MTLWQKWRKLQKKLDKLPGQCYNTIRKKKKGENKMNELKTELLKQVDELKKQGKEPHGYLRELLDEMSWGEED